MEFRICSHIWCYDAWLIMPRCILKIFLGNFITRWLVKWLHMHKFWIYIPSLRLSLYKLGNMYTCAWTPIFLDLIFFSINWINCYSYKPWFFSKYPILQFDACITIVDFEFDLFLTENVITCVENTFLKNQMQIFRDYQRINL